MPVKRNWGAVFDTTLDIPIQTQVDNPAATRADTLLSINPRTVLGGDNFPYNVGDLPVAPRGAKNIIWSSEGYTTIGNNLAAAPSSGFGPQGNALTAAAPGIAIGGVTIPALTANQKKTTGSAISATTGNIGTILGATPPPLDFSPYRSLDAVITLSTFTGGTSIQFEIDMQDDAGTPNSVAAWKPAALTATQTMILVHIGLDQPYVQTTAAASSEPATGFTAQAALPSGVLFYPVYLPLLPQGNFQWTIVGTFTAIAWTAFLYGRY